MTRQNLLPTLIAVVIGAAGVLILLFAWRLPPFSSADPVTENAYVQGRVTSIAPQLAGYLSAVEVTDFQTVKAGDEIARIDDRIFQQKLAQAKAARAAAQAALQIARQNVASAQAGLRADQATLDAARSSADIAQTNRDRSKALRERGAASQSSDDQSELTLAKAQAAVEEAEAQIEVRNEAIKSAEAQISAREADIASAEASVGLAQIDLEHAVIRAPADGRLGQVSARVGQYVTAGTSLVSLVGVDRWVIANFKETEIAGMKAGQSARFTVDAMGGRAFTGKVQAFSPATGAQFSVLAASNATGNFTKIAQRVPVRIAIDPGQDQADALVPGLSVEAKVLTRD